VFMLARCFGFWRVVHLLAWATHGRSVTLPALAIHDPICQSVRTLGSEVFLPSPYPTDASPLSRQVMEPYGGSGGAVKLGSGGGEWPLHSLGEVWVSGPGHWSLGRRARSLRRYLRSGRRLLITVSVVRSSPILVILMKEALSSSETSVLTRATRRNIPEDTLLHCHRRENLKSYVSRYWLVGWLGWVGLR
jgi:hypothetical protein